MEAENPRFSEEAYLGIQEDISLYFDALLSRAEEMEVVAMRTSELIQNTEEIELRLASMQQIAAKNELLRGQTLDTLASNLQELDQRGDVLAKLQRFQTQFDLSPSAIAALQEPLGPKFVAAYDEIAQLLSSPDFDAIYQRAQDQSATLFQRLQGAQQTIIQHFMTQLEGQADPRGLKEYKKQFQFCRVFGAKTGSLKLHAVFGLYEDGLRQRTKRLMDKLEDLAKFPFSPCYQPAVAPPARHILADFNLFMPQLTMGQRRSIVDAQVAGSAILAKPLSLYGFSDSELEGKAQTLYLNYFLFSSTHAGRDQFKEVSATTPRPVQQSFLGSLLQSRGPKVSRIAFDQQIYPEHVLAQIIKEAMQFIVDAKLEFADIFGTKFRFKFDLLYTQLRPLLSALIAQLDFVGCCSFYTRADALAKEPTEPELREIITAFQTSAGQKLTLFYKQIVANVTPQLAHEVEPLLETLQGQTAFDDRLSGIEGEQAKVIHLMQDLIEQDSESVPSCSTLAFRSAALLDTLRKLNGTALEPLSNTATHQILQFITESATKLFQNHRNPSGAAFAFVTNFAAVLARAGLPIDLETYKDQLRFATGGRGDDLLATYAQEKTKE